MTYDKNTTQSDGYQGYGGPRGDRHDGQGPRWGSSDPLAWAKRPGFHPLKAVAVVAGFAIAPPLGVLALGYFLWTNRWQGWRQGGAAMAGGSPFSGAGRCGGRGRGPLTGNRAFDEHQMEQINKLREDRRAFHEHRWEQRRKRDQEAYDAFRTAQDVKPAGEEPTAKS